MAWRIHDHVTRGEVDNRERGVVRGRIWLCGRAEPVVLELTGNACPDLAGCLLTFENPGKAVALPPDRQLAAEQRGTAGDLTASRKVRVLDRSPSEFFEAKDRGLPVPERLANCVYLEWFSEADGRVVIESTDYRVSISPPAWTLTPEEEEQRQRDARSGFQGFLSKLSAALEAAKHEPPADKPWDEYDYERLMRESDARTDKYGELLDKYMDHPDGDQIIAREMGWSDPEDELDDEVAESGTEDDGEGSSLDVDEIDRMSAESAAEPLEPEPATEGVDWVRDEDGDVHHPLALRAFNGSLALWRHCEALGLERSEDADLSTLVGEFQVASAKLAGALNSLAYGRDLREGPFVVAYLKRALSHVHAAQAALEKVAARAGLPAEVLATTRTELFGIRDEIVRLMSEFRGHTRS